MRARLQARLPILFVHSNGWDQSSTGDVSSPAWACREEPHGGNYWDKDGVPSSHPDAFGQLGSAYGPGPGALVQQIVDGSWRTDDWSKCPPHVGRTTCDDVPEMSDFSKRVDVLKGALDAYNQKAQNLFALPGTTSLGSGCWADRCGRTSATRWIGRRTRFVKRLPRNPWSLIAILIVRARNLRGAEGTGQLRRQRQQSCLYRTREP